MSRVMTSRPSVQAIRVGDIGCGLQDGSKTFTGSNGFVHETDKNSDRDLAEIAMSKEDGWVIGSDSLSSSAGVEAPADGASDSGTPLAASAKRRSVKLGSPTPL
ncbi:hypothetical protein BDR04DRAFT_1206754 [Suillus decipiens]|nr:hypothetical protein BDR04DRAFT_1206754 [Suillus decipiens]